MAPTSTERGNVAGNGPSPEQSHDPKAVPASLQTWRPSQPCAPLQATERPGMHSGPSVVLSAPQATVHNGNGTASSNARVRAPKEMVKAWTLFTAIAPC